MKTERNNLDHFKGKNPFTVPEGYMEGLTANIMSRLPEKSPKEKGFLDGPCSPMALYGSGVCRFGVVF